MEVICTPSNGLLAIIVDISSGKIVRHIPIPAEVQTDSKIRPFGITKDVQNNWYIANNNTIVYCNPDLTLRSILSGLPADIHQLHYDAMGGKLWAVATSIDSLLSINTDNNFIERFCLRRNEWIDINTPAFDTLHFNSMLWHDDKLYVIARKFDNVSCVYTYNKHMERISKWNIAREAHSLCMHKGQLLLLDSRGGRILGNHTTRIQVCEKKHYTRGMVVTPEGLAIVAIFDFGARETRQNGDAFLRVFNLTSGQQLNEIFLPKMGNIQDIQQWKQM